MTRSVIDGTVEWTGDNPFIYLGEDERVGWASLSLMFRIAWSRFGPGNAILVLEAPELTTHRDAAPAFCASDNERLARDLVERFVPRFGAFREAAALELLNFVAAHDFHCGDDSDGSYVARCDTDEYGIVALTWGQLRVPFSVDAPPAETATGEHVMLSVFRPADAASVVVGGREQPGGLRERDFFGGRSMSAGLAFSETWIRVNG